MRLISAVLVLVVALPARADVCSVSPARIRQQRVVSQVYSAPATKTVVRETVRQYVAPQANSYTHSGLAYAYADNHLGLNYAFRVGYDVREDAVAEKVYQKLLADGTVAATISRVVAASLKTSGAPPAADPATPPADQPNAAGDKFRGVLERNSCLKCHNAEKKSGGLDLSGEVSEVVRWRAYNAVLTGAMPQGGVPVGDAEVDQFRQWAEAGKAD